METTDVMHATIPALSFVNCHNLSGQSDKHPGIAASGYDEQMKNGQLHTNLDAETFGITFNTSLII